MAIKFRNRLDARRIADALDNRAGVSKLVDRALASLKDEPDSVEAVEASKMVLEAWHVAKDKREKEAAEKPAEEKAAKDPLSEEGAPAATEAEAEAIAQVEAAAAEKRRKEEEAESRNQMVEMLKKMEEARRKRDEAKEKAEQEAKAASAAWSPIVTEPIKSPDPKASKVADPATSALRHRVWGLQARRRGQREARAKKLGMIAALTGSSSNETLVKKEEEAKKAEAEAAEAKAAEEKAAAEAKAKAEAS